jgi:endonuclease/exonuclease/phosphatase family metal-dependent hydrolase
MDARRHTARRRASATFPSAFPLLRIDHMFVTADIRVAAIHAPYEPATRVASDHLPLVMDFAI